MRLGFLADFLSRSVLIGFLTGVGVQVAMGQLAGMLGVESGTGGTLKKFFHAVSEIPDTSLSTLAVTLSVIVVILGAKRIDKRIPGALIAVVGAIFVELELGSRDARCVDARRRTQRTAESRVPRRHAARSSSTCSAPPARSSS